jgi:hypothetical protein
MAFEEIAPRILAAERDAGSDRLSTWLKQQGKWFADQAYDIADAELRALYFGLREAVEAWLWEPAEDGAQAPASAGEDAGAADMLTALVAGEPAPGRPGETDETEGPADQTATRQDMTGSDPGEQEPEHGSVADEPSVAEKLGLLWQRIRKWDASAKYAAAFEKADPGAAELDQAACLWEWIHLVGLRLPMDKADQLRAMAQDAAGAEHADVAGAGTYLVPPLPEVGYEGVNIGYEQPGPVEGVALMLASAQQMDWLAEHDPAVMVGYEIINRGGTLMRFDDGKRDMYQGLVATKLKREPEISELVQLDELIRGVVPVPMPSEDSWWRSRLKQSEQTLTECLGEKVRVPQVGTPYKSLLDQGLIDSQGLRISVADANGPPRGNVAWVLRAWSNQKHQVRGRVVYVDGE